MNSSNFNYNDLTAIRTFSGRVRYCRNFLPFIGRGSSRIVFQLPNGHALKLASNKKGMMQNEQEHLYEQYAQTLGIVPITYAGADDETWIEVELATKVKSSDFPSLVGVNMKDFFNFLQTSYCLRSTSRSARFAHMPISQEKYVDMLEQHQELAEWDDYIANSEPVVSDMLRPSQYGKVKRKNYNQLVLVDYGLTDDIFNNYYLHI